MVLPIILILGGFVLLYYGAEFVVGGSCTIARRLGIPAVIVGLTVVSFGTSLPEAFVSVVAALMGNPNICVSNVIGSNIINIGLVLGCSALLYPLTIDKTLLKSEVPFMVGVSLLMMFFSWDRQIGRIEGLVLCGLLVWFNRQMVINARRRKEEVTVEAKAANIPKSVVLMIFGFIGLTAGASLLVDNASYIAEFFGVPQWVIGMTIVATGTSLPELATSVVASARRESDISVGNIVGSNIFNILFVIGLSSVITPLSLQGSPHIMTDIAAMMVFSLIIIPFMRTKMELERWEGAVLVGMYVAFTVFLIIRQ